MALDHERGARGHLVVKDRAVARIAVAAALGVPGVVRQSGGLFKLPGRDLPRAEVSMGPESVAVALYIAVSWPCPIAVLSREVQREVGERIETLTGLPMDTLHVVVAAAVPGDAGTPADVDTRQLVAEVPADCRPTPPRAPLARPAAALVTVFVAAGLLIVAGLTGREFLIAKDVIAPAAWLRNSVSWVAGLHWQSWMLPTATLATLTGLALVYLAVTPRTRTHLPVGKPKASVVWVRPTDVARMCSARARTVAGIRSVQTTVDRRRATVHVAPTGEVHAHDLEATVRDAVQPGLAMLATPRELRVRIGRVKS
ncbi:Asp23/Gls24 family envelope stress response protein [Rhodococcus spelaei]|uniref:Asp23/Gls24 family envelope stress response protein n=1 Tax=Rhodococcus spelaei TaxID=2546320 RepID=A0A541B983_9NOCA|nr:Asp23/Gls24 family envelope stress response protein [Rhodococcus spelaei]